MKATWPEGTPLTDAAAGAGVLKGYVNSGDVPLLAECWEGAADLVLDHVGTAYVPQSVLLLAVLEVAAELFHRKNAPGGISQFAAIDGAAPVRMARNPMVAAYPLLAPYLPGGFA